jgi:hypothetical protein
VQQVGHSDSPRLFGTQRFIAVLIKADHCALFWASWFQSIPHILFFRIHFNIILLSVRLPNGLIPSVLPTETLYAVSQQCLRPYRRIVGTPALPFFWHGSSFGLFFPRPLCTAVPFKSAYCKCPSLVSSHLAHVSFYHFSSRRRHNCLRAFFFHIYFSKMFTPPQFSPHAHLVFWDICFYLLEIRRGPWHQVRSVQ